MPVGVPCTVQYLPPTAFRYNVIQIETHGVVPGFLISLRHRETDFPHYLSIQEGVTVRAAEIILPSLPLSQIMPISYLELRHEYRQPLCGLLVRYDAR